VDWLTREPRAAAYSLGQVNLPLPAARVLDLQGKEVPTRGAPGATVFDAPRPGLYTALARDQRMRVAINVLDPHITAINASRLAQAPPEASRPVRVAWAIDPWVVLLLVGVLLLTGEWWAYHRRLTV
jgi:hypothetical protein